MPTKHQGSNNNDDGQIYSPRELQRAVFQLNTDIYIGKDIDNPSVTTRLALIEKSMNDLGRIKWYLLAAVLGLVIDIIKGFLKF